MNIDSKKIDSTKGTPEITLNPAGFIRIKGRSMNANIAEFFKQIEDWIDLYLSDPADETCFDIYLEYLDTTNLNFYITLLKKVELIKLKNKKYIINWYYEEGDEDIAEKGEDISSILNLPFNFIMLHEHNDI
jgi:SiaC family regulatory phosphoprotein